MIRIKTSPASLHDRLARKHGLGKRSAKPRTCTLLVCLGLVLSLACQARAQSCPVGAFTGAGPAGCGVQVGTRVYLPGLTLTQDLALYVLDSEEPATFVMCLQLAHGVVCYGVRP